MYVICFYWKGERWQEEYVDYSTVTGDTSFRAHLQRVGPADQQLVSLYINNLYRGVKRWADRPFKFVCFTNEPLSVFPEVELRSFPMVTRSGVLPRMYMFSREAGLFGHQVLSLDIDVVIVGPLDDIMAYNGLYCTRQSWSKTEWGQLDGDIMSFRAGPENEARFWTPLISDVAEAERISTGRERLWVRHVTGGKADMWHEVLPGSQVVSLKHHVRKRNELPSVANRIVSCHGHPRPHVFNGDWRKANWPTFEEMEERGELEQYFEKTNQVTYGT